MSHDLCIFFKPNCNWPIGLFSEPIDESVKWKAAVLKKKVNKLLFLNSRRFERGLNETHSGNAPFRRTSTVYSHRLTVRTVHWQEIEV